MAKAIMMSDAQFSTLLRINGRRRRRRRKKRNYLETLDQTDIGYKILGYLLQHRETYPRDESLSNATGARKSAL